MIKQTGRKISARIYWVAAAFVLLALVAIPLLSRALGQADNTRAANPASRPAYSPSITSQTATVPGVRSLPILMPNFQRTILYDEYNSRGPNHKLSEAFTAKRAFIRTKQNRLDQWKILARRDVRPRSHRHCQNFLQNFCSISNPPLPGPEGGRLWAVGEMQKLQVNTRTPPSIHEKEIYTPIGIL